MVFLRNSRGIKKKGTSKNLQLLLLRTRRKLLSFYGIRSCFIYNFLLQGQEIKKGRFLEVPKRNIPVQNTPPNFRIASPPGRPAMTENAVS
jgi:hypothetical protein